MCDNGSDDELETFRPRFLVDHLRAIAGSGLPIERYYHWCFVDNWEWQYGMTPRFGIVHLDRDTMARTARPSGHLLADVVRDRGVTQESLDRCVRAPYRIAPT